MRAVSSARAASASAGSSGSGYGAPSVTARAFHMIVGVIDRYTRPEIGSLWTDEARMEAWRKVEVAACEEMDGPSKDELEAIRGATFTVAAVQEREKVTDHDVAAFVDVLSDSAGEAGRWIHYGLTSSDVLDTALALQLRRAGEVVVPGARELAATLADRAREFAGTLCA